MYIVFLQEASQDLKVPPISDRLCKCQNLLFIIFKVFKIYRKLSYNFLRFFFFKCKNVKTGSDYTAGHTWLVYSGSCTYKYSSLELI